MVKPGIKTTEFWATVLVTLGGFTTSIASTSLSGQNAVIASLVALGLYILSRVIVKVKAVPSIPQLLTLLEGTLPLLSGTPHTLAGVEATAVKVAAAEGVTPPPPSAAATEIAAYAAPLIAEAETAVKKK